jgi:uncharacterized protein (DUF433 family)
MTIIRFQMHRVPQNRGAVIKLIFEEANRQRMSIQALGKRSGITGAAIGDWKNRHNPRLIDVEAVLGALGIKLTWEFAEHRPTPEPYKEIADALRDGMLAQDIMAMFKCSKKTLTEVRQMYGIPKPSREPGSHLRATHARWRRIMNDYEAGMRFEEIMEKYDCCRSTIRSARKFYGIPHRVMPRALSFQRNVVAKRPVSVSSPSLGSRALT